jgi:hypothetical protein
MIESRPIPAPVWILGAVTLVAGAGTGVLGGLVLSDRNNLANSCSPFCSSSQTSPLQTKILLTDVAAGVTAAAGLGTLFFFLARPTISYPAASSGVGGAVTFLPGGGVEAQLSKSF